MTSGVLLDKAQIIQAIHKNFGILTRAAKSISINERSIYDWIDRDPEVAQAVKEARALAERNRESHDLDLTDEAYRSLNYLLKSNDTTATIFTMKAKAKWAEHKKENEIASGQTKIEVIDYSKAI